jgi:hypothetical protein
MCLNQVPVVLLYMGIVVDVVIFMRIARYMRIAQGLKAFYQVGSRSMLEAWLVAQLIL